MMFKTCVIGNGFLGKHFLAAYRQFYPDTLATSRGGEEGIFSFDLVRSSPEFGFLKGKGYVYALIVAGVSKVAQCEKDKPFTFLCNVEKTASLAAHLAEQGVTPIVFSTDYIFDGVNGDYTEESPLSPLNEYGRQKAELEKRVKEECNGNYLLIRPGKVFTVTKGDGSLLDEMVFNLRRGSSVKAARDQVFCPIFIHDLIRAVFSLQALHLRGTYHICGAEKWIRYDLAVKIAERLSVPSNLIYPISLDDLQESFIRPKRTTMLIDKLTKTIQIEMTPMENCIEKITAAYEPIPKC